VAQQRDGANLTLAQKLANEEARNGRTRDDGRGLARLSTNERRPILGGERRCLMQSVVAADDSQTATRAGQGQWKWLFLGGAEMPRSVSNWLL
jgi:hypothetical protein